MVAPSAAAALDAVKSLLKDAIEMLETNNIDAATSAIELTIEHIDAQMNDDDTIIEIEDDEPDSEEAFDSFAWDLSEPDINPSAPLTLPSLLLSEMDNARTAVQLDETVSETLMRELNNLTTTTAGSAKRWAFPKA